ncbi:hypothetical protein A2U01_0111666, partial [Trifolium medium]|nr:hypothetical protein [Trifolium medium]
AGLQSSGSYTFLLPAVPAETCSAGAFSETDHETTEASDTWSGYVGPGLHSSPPSRAVYV